MTMSLALTMTVSCMRRSLLNSYKPTYGGWLSTDTIRFQVDSITRNDIYSFSVGLRYTDRYPYQDIWLALSITTSTTTHIDTLHLQLLDLKPNLVERGVMIHEQEQLVKAYRLAKGQKVDIAVYSLMRDSLLEGITDLGLKVE